MTTTTDLTKTIRSLADDVLAYESDDAKWAILNEALHGIAALADYDEETEEWTFEEKIVAELLRSFRDVYRRGARDVYTAMRQAASSML